jgi:2-octaprenyl-6-methoxyphenol hydroxylase
VSRDAVDVAIAGGGMVGASLACALAPHCRVAVIESFPLPAGAGAPLHQPSFDARSTALSLSSVAFFESLGLWEAIRRHAAAIRHIHVSDRGRFGSTRMSAADEGLEALGHVAENQWIGAVLHGALRAAAGIDLLAPARVEALQPEPDGVRLQVAQADGMRTLHARLAVIADGARSALAARLGIRTELREYGQSALIANVAHAQPHDGVAFERFTGDGPLAMLPLPDAPDGRARSALVWVQPPGRAAEARALAPADFLRRLQQRFGYRLGRLLAVGERHVYPLGLAEASEQARAGIVLLGNAAHTLHPVAGQGFNLSLRDVAALVGSVRGALAAGRSPGELALLMDYVAARRSDHAGTIGFSDALPRVFGSGLLPLVVARDAGLIALELLPPARSLLVRHATGLVTA